MEKIKDVHTEHCCQRHGCKYHFSPCTVMTLRALQSYPCEWCFDEEELRQAYELNDMFNKGMCYATGRLITWAMN